MSLCGGIDPRLVGRSSDRVIPRLESMAPRGTQIQLVESPTTRTWKNTLRFGEYTTLSGSRILNVLGEPGNVGGLDGQSCEAFTIRVALSEAGSAGPTCSHSAPSTTHAGRASLRRREPLGPRPLPTSSPLPSWRGAFRTDKPSKEARIVPARARLAIGDLFHGASVKSVEVGGRLQIYRLIHVIRGRVVALLAPALDVLVLGRILDEADLERERGNPLPDEAVLVAADEGVTFRLRVGEDSNAEGASHLGQVGGEVRLFQALHDETGKRKERREHIRVQVRHDALTRHRRMGGVVAGAQKTLLLGGHGEKDHRPPQARLTFLEQASGLDKGGDPRSIVHGAVVDLI